MHSNVIVVRIALVFGVVQIGGSDLVVGAKMVHRANDSDATRFDREVDSVNYYCCWNRG